jgi:two-component system response regulator ChvI
MSREGDSPVLQQRRIVLVDDDALFRESVSQNLIDASFAVTDLADGESTLRYLSQRHPVDLVILDWKMPGMNGIEVLRLMRERNHQVPVIFLTVLSDQIFEEAALQGGAVDFVDKSRSFSILLKRIDLILHGPKLSGETKQQGTPAATDSVRRGDLELRPKIGRAFWKGRQVDLSLTEFKIVQLLSGRAGEDVGYREIYDVVHGERFAAGYGPEGYRTNVRTFVKRVRQKFRDIDQGFEEIENYPGFGYRWRRR